MNILGTSQISAERLTEYVRRNNPSFDGEIAKAFIEVGSVYGIRGDLAMCQSIVETDWFRFGNGTAVTPDQHNYCGLGVLTKGMKGHSFPTIKDGVRAQLQHLYAYASTKPLPSGEQLIDPRFTYVERGIAPTWNDLGGRWAADKKYGDIINGVYQPLVSSENIDKGVVTKMAKVVIDAGHGGKDSGCVSPDQTMMEKNIVLAIALKMRDILVAEYPGIEVKLIRDNDVFYELSQRARIANAWGADIFISIHCNGGGGFGFESYRMKGQSDAKTMKLQGCMHDALMEFYGKSNRKDRGQRDANYAVLRETNMTACLTENLFMDDPNNEIKKFQDPNYVYGVANAHAVGVARYFGIASNGNKPNVSVPSNGEEIGTLTVTGDNVRIRSGAGTNYDVAGKLGNSATRKVFAEVNGWLKINEGFVFYDSSYIRFDRKPKPTPKPEGGSGETFLRVIAGSYTDRDNANETIRQLKSYGIDAFLVPFEKDGTNYLRVVAGSYKERANAEEMVRELASHGIQGFLVAFTK